MTYTQALNCAMAWLELAESEVDGDERYLALSDGWLKVAAEIRQSASLTVQQADTPVERRPVRWVDL